MTKTKLSSAFLAVVLSLFCLSSCYTVEHTVGKGAQGDTKHEKRLWYALWGLVPLGDFDSHQLAGEAKDYSVKSEHTILDIVIGFFTTWVTIQCQTVTVTK